MKYGYLYVPDIELKYILTSRLASNGNVSTANMILLFALK